MSYTRDINNLNRYTKKVTLYVQLPDGQTQTRKTDHVYKFASVVYSCDRVGKPATWGVLSWHETRKSAETRISQWRKYFPAGQWAIVTVLENEPAPLTDIAATPEPTAPAPAPQPEPEPMPACAIKTTAYGMAYVRIILFADGVAVRNLAYKKIIARRYILDLITKHDYKLIEDGAKAVSPVSTYNP